MINTLMFIPAGLVTYFGTENKTFGLVGLVFSVFLWLIGEGVIYKRYWVGVKPRYPLGVADQDDVYFPRFNIPRPLYLDERKRREREESKIENDGE